MSVSGHRLSSGLGVDGLDMEAKELQVLPGRGKARDVLLSVRHFTLHPSFFFTSIEGIINETPEIA